jgi:acetylornithine deacetylase/succinyl-diaminopimelate desuccinylase-like protein
MRIFLALALTLALSAAAAEIDYSKLNAETLEHFSKLLRIDTSSPPGNESLAVDYLKTILDKEQIPYQIFTLEKDRANLVARIKGNGTKRPIIVMGHTDVVGVQRDKWTVEPFAATRKDGYIYGRGANDDKDQLTAALMTIIAIKRANIALDRDIIFVAEAGEEGESRLGIGFLVDQHWDAIDAEFAIAEGGFLSSRDGKVVYNAVASTEKVPRGVTLTARGVAGHGSVPRLDNAVAHIAMAVGKLAQWEPPMRLNDTTRTYFERLAAISSPADAQRYKDLFVKSKTAAVQKYLRENEQQHYSILRTSVVPTMIRAGFRTNVIPSETTATLDIRALPDEDIDKFYDAMRAVINDSQVELQPSRYSMRPAGAPSPLDSELFRAIEKVTKQMFPGAITLPSMLTGATDMAQLRAKGVKAYGIGPIFDEKDRTTGGAHSDDERVLEEGLYKVTEMTIRAVLEVAGSKK